MTDLSRRQNLLIAGCLLVSLLLHLLLLLLPDTGLLRRVEREAPVVVEIRPPERRDRELELPPAPPPPKPRETPARRLAEQDRVVKRETAPPAEDAEDLRRSARTPQVQASPPPLPAPAPTPAAPPGEPARPLSPTGEWPAPAPPAPRPAPSLEQLTQLSPNTLARMERDWRKKLREGVERGDTVWLDTEQDLLISFFRRFKTNIYNVWNYPERARLREEQGSCLLRIVVSRQGTIDDVELLESSGSRDLDDEAMRAVRKGQPYGPLPAAYPHEQLNIMAYFRYALGKTFKYPGRISGER